MKLPAVAGCRDLHFLQKMAASFFSKKGKCRTLSEKAFAGSDKRGWVPL
jgi:hypothetical protein